MRAEDLRLNIDFRFGGPAKLEPNLGSRVANMVIQNVGFRAGRQQQEMLKRNLYRDFMPIVERELQTMARDVSRMGIGLANPNNPPPGSLAITGRVAAAMVGNSGSMTIASVTGTWAVRNKTYMKSKFKHHRTRRWFQNTGKLKAILAKIGTYTSAYGPISVKFTPANLSDVTTFAVGRSQGNQFRYIHTGNLSVTPLRRISLSDLPGIGQKAEGPNNRILGGLPADAKRKLTGRADKYRPVLEPFLTYYLNRKIPNAVYRKLEDTISGRTGR